MCFVSTLRANKIKFSPRARVVIFPGYPFCFKGYEILDIETESVSISRNIIFHEDFFPFPKGSTGSNTDISSKWFHDKVLPRLIVDADQYSLVLSIVS